jgi:LDH2 family malate/lactate/ureidoglycolate dehydrogenase
VTAPAVESAAVAVDELRDFLDGALAGAGLDPDEAHRIADALTEAELTGNPTHGVLRLPGYLDGLRGGRYASRRPPTVTPVTEALTLVDGHGALGHRPTWTALAAAVGSASRTGVGVAGVRGIAEFGRAAYYVAEAARRGHVAVVCQNTQPLLGAPGGGTATHGNNPLAFSAPAAEAPVFDAAWTPRSGGELLRRRALGQPIPLDWGYVDEDGHPTDDPAAAFRGVHPAVGGAKGFGLAVLVDLLAGILPGAASGTAVRPGHPDTGAFVLVLDPAAFGTSDRLGPALADSAATVRATGGRWPGDRARQARLDHLASGSVRIPTPIWNAARAAAATRQSAPAPTEGP